MGRLYFTVGLPASGKSTYFEKIKEWHPDAIHISSDNIREEVFGDVNRQDKNAEVFKIMEERTYETLAANGVCYYDATNLSAKRRIAFLKNMKARLKHRDDISFTCLLFVPILKECIERDKDRERTVGINVIMRMVKQFQPPHISEGWNSIQIATPIRGNAWRETIAYIKTLTGFEHFNPYHTYSVGNHCLEARRYAEEHDFGEIVSKAAVLHDVGKKVTQVFKNRKGEDTEDAHYYNHENVSAYYCLAYRWSSDDKKWLEISNLIVWHMIYYNKEWEKAIRKILDRYGSFFVKNLYNLHLCDENSH
jgi:predicted kinase